MKELVELLARALVNQPDEVVVSERDAENGIVVELRVAKEDLGRIIGKQGRTAKSLRTIVNAAAANAKSRVALEILEES